MGTRKKRQKTAPHKNSSKYPRLAKLLGVADEANVKATKRSKDVQSDFRAQQHNSMLSPKMMMSNT